MADSAEVVEAKQRLALSLTDLKLSLALVVLACLLFLPGLGKLEYFRHTEADRTLISWEMAESGNYLVPHILSEPILTKPPLYYWLSAWAISSLGSASEFNARIVSLIAACLFVLVQYFAFRLAQFSEEKSAIAAIFLATSGAFFLLAQAAEIDMLFGLFCASAIYCSYFAVVTNRFRWTSAMYFMAALAFLTKGPPIVFFIAAGHPVFFLGFHWLSMRSFKIGWRAIADFFWQNIAGIILFSAIVACWLLPFANAVGWEEIARQFEVEVVERIVSESSRRRGPFFYFGSLAIGVLPWTFFLVLALGRKIWLVRKAQWCWAPFVQSLNAVLTTNRMFFLHSAIFSVLSVAMLSLAEGKSNRYVFPVQVFVLNFSVVGYWSIFGTAVEGKLLKYIAYLLAVLVPSCVLVLPFITISGVSTSGIWLFIFAAFCAGSCFFYQSWKFQNPELPPGHRRRMVFAAVLSVFFALKIGYWQIYVPHRNFVKSVRPLANRVDQVVPKGMVVFNLSMFERWLNYYLKHLGRESLSLGSSLARKLIAEKPDEDAYLLLSAKTERTVARQILKSSNSAKTVLVGDSIHQIMLLRIKNGQLLSWLEKYQKTSDPLR